MNAFPMRYGQTYSDEISFKWKTGMDNFQNCDGNINIPSSQTYKSHILDLHISVITLSTHICQLRPLWAKCHTSQLCKISCERKDIKYVQFALDNWYFTTIREPLIKCIRIEGGKNKKFPTSWTSTRKGWDLILKIYFKESLLEV
jgi:hypothetical protein